MDKIMLPGEELSLADCLLLENGNTIDKDFDEDFTEDEKMELADQMSTIIDEIDRIKSLQKKVSSLMRDLNNLSDDFRRATKVVTGQCTWYLDKEQNTAYLRRDGTNEIVSARSLTAEERQQGLKFKPEDMSEEEVNEILNNGQVSSNV